MARSSTNGLIRPFQYTTSRGEKRWMCKIDIGKTMDGKRRRKTVTDKTYKGCQRKLNEVLKQLRAGTLTMGARRPFNKVALEWLAQRKKEVDPKTYQGYKTMLTRHMGDYAGADIHTITPRMIQDILDQAQAYNQKGHPVGPAGISTKKQLLTVINQVMKYAQANQLCEYNPAQAVTPPRLKDAQPGRQAFSVIELKAMLHTASQQPITEGAIWWFRLLTGMRQGEILGATWDDYNSRNHYYTVNWKLQPTPYQHGCRIIHGQPSCGRKTAGTCPKKQFRVPDGYAMRQLEGRWTLSRPKSKTGRIVPIIPPLAEVLDRLKKEDKHPNPHNLIFHEPDGRPIEPKTDTIRFKQLMRDSGINPDNHTGHETRHSVVTLLMASGADVMLVQEIVGHSSAAMVEHYRHANLEERMNAMDRIGTTLGIEEKPAEL